VSRYEKRTSDDHPEINTFETSNPDTQRGGSNHSRNGGSQLPEYTPYQFALLSGVDIMIVEEGLDKAQRLWIKPTVIGLIGV
jgi:hypothetical protein